MEQIWKCRIKIVVNRRSPLVHIQKTDFEKKIVNIKIIITQSEDLPDAIKNIKHVLSPDYEWNMEWNWNNVPKEIENDFASRSAIAEMYSGIKLKKASTKVKNNPNFHISDDFRDLNSQNTGSKKEENDLDELLIHADNIKQYSFHKPNSSQNEKKKGIKIAKTKQMSKFDSIAAHLVTHMAINGSHPEFSPYAREDYGKLGKMINYIKTTMSKKDYSEEEYIAIVDKIIELKSKV